MPCWRSPSQLGPTLSSPAITISSSSVPMPVFPSSTRPRPSPGSPDRRPRKRPGRVGASVVTTAVLTATPESRRRRPRNQTTSVTLGPRRGPQTVPLCGTPRSRPRESVPGADHRYLFISGLGPGCVGQFVFLCCYLLLLSGSRGDCFWCLGPSALLRCDRNGRRGIGGLGHFQSEQGRNITVVEHLPGAWHCLCQRKVLSGAGDQFIFIHTAQHEQQLGFIVEPGTDTIERRGDMFAHICPVRTAAGQLDFAGRRKQ